MKKTIAASALFAALALVACGPAKEEPTPAPSPADDVVVPVAEGKTTLYFEMAEDSVVPADYASIYLAGVMTNWATGLEAPVFTKLGETRIYYVQIDTPEDPSAWINADSGAYDYQLVLGYNESSNMAASKLGLQWNDAYKADQTTTGTSNPCFEWDGVAQKIDLGSQRWSTQVLAPAAPLANVTFFVTLSEALPAGYNVHMAGSHQGWGFDNSLMSPNEDRTKWSITFESIYADTYEFQLLAEEEGVEGLTWAHKSAANEAVGGGNLSITVTDLNEGGEVDVLLGDTTSFVL